MDLVCKYFQCGFCKFGETCKKQHVKEICSIKYCTNKSCTKRHPTVCKFFSIQKTCKFGDHCAYKHDAISNKSEIDELHVKVIHLEASNELMLAKLNDFTKGMKDTNKNEIAELNDQITYLQASNAVMQARINDLTEEVEDIERDKLAVPKDIHFKCDQCDYSASTSTVLKSHISMKHKSSVQHCEKCSYEATTDTELNEHYLSSHMPDIPAKAIETIDDAITLENKRSKYVANLSVFENYCTTMSSGHPSTPSLDLNVPF